MLFLALFLTHLLTSAQEEPQTKTADFVQTENNASIRIFPDSRVLSTISNTLVVQNEKGRIALSLKEIPYSSTFNEINVLEAYTSNFGINSKTDLKKIEKRSVSESNFGIENTQKIIIPFNNVKVGSAIYYKYTDYIATPLIKGVSELVINFFEPFPQIKADIEINATQPLQIHISDANKTLNVQKAKNNSNYKIQISFNKPIININSIATLPLYPTGFFPFAIITTAKEWRQIINPLYLKYEEKITQPIPPEFLKIVDAAKLILSDNEKFKFVMSEISRLIVYSGNWTTIDKRIYPKDQAEVATEGKGDCKDFATILTSILRHLGYEANIALTSMQNSKIRLFRDLEIEDFVPALSYFNHAVTVVSKNNKLYWLDPTRIIANADSIWPELAGSPAIILKANENKIIKIPEHPPSVTNIKMTRTVDFDKSENARWSGEFKIKGQGSVELIEIEKTVGKANMQKIWSKLLLSELENEKTSIKDDAIFDLKNSQISITFDTIAKNPIFEEEKIKKTKILVPSFLSLTPFFQDGKDTGLYLGSLSNTEYKTIFKNINTKDEIETNCFILSKWADFERVSENQNNDLIVYESFFLKKSLITKEEYNSNDFKIFQTKLLSCFLNKNNDVSKNSTNAITESEKFKIAPVSEKSYDLAVTEYLYGSELDINYKQLKQKRIFDLRLKNNPSDIIAEIYRAGTVLSMGYINRNEYLQSYIEFAIRELTSVIKKDETNSLAYYIRGKAFLSLGQYGKAIADAKKAFQNDETNFRYRLLLSKIYLALKKYQLAKDWLNSQSNLSLFDKKLRLTQLSEIEDTIGNRVIAENYLAEIVKLEPNSPWAIHNLALQQYLNDKYDDAEKNERKAIAIMSFGAAESTLANILSARGNSALENYKKNLNVTLGKKIEDDFIESLKYKPKNKEALFGLVVFYIHKIDEKQDTELMDKADIYLKEAIITYPFDKDIIELNTFSYTSKASLVQDYQNRRRKLKGRWVSDFNNPN